MCYDRHMIQHAGMHAMTNYDLSCYRELLGETLYQAAVAQGLVGTRPLPPTAAAGGGAGGDAVGGAGVQPTAAAGDGGQSIAAYGHPVSAPVPNAMCNDTMAVAQGAAAVMAVPDSIDAAAVPDSVPDAQAIDFFTPHNAAMPPGWGLTVTTTGMHSHEVDVSPSMHSMQAATGATLWRGLVAETPTSQRKPSHHVA